MKFTDNKHSTALFCTWTVLAVLVLAGDYYTGVFIRFPITYLLPITLAAWFNGLGRGLVFAVLMPLIHLSFSKYWFTPFTLSYAAINTLIRIAVFVAFAYLVHKVGVQKRALEKEIQTLKGILPICSFCKKIRNSEGNWENLEHYITTRSEAEFSHGMCLDCAKKNYPQFFEE